MSKITLQIPDDLITDARIAMSLFIDELDERRDEAVDIVARALLAEREDQRERDAKITDEYAKVAADSPIRDDDTLARVAQTLLRESFRGASHAIRKGEA